MGKLPAAAIAAAKEAKAFTPSDGGELWPVGRYICLLAEYETKEGREFPYWNMRFQPVKKYDQQGVGGSQFDILSHSPESAGAQKAFFEAFGYAVDSDIDEIVGGGDDGTDFAWVYVGLKNKQEKNGDGKYVDVEETGPDGKKTKVKKNFVRGYMPITEDDELPPLADE